MCVCVCVCEYVCEYACECVRACMQRMCVYVHTHVSLHRQRHSPCQTLGPERRQQSSSGILIPTPEWTGSQCSGTAAWLVIDGGGSGQQGVGRFEVIVTIGLFPPPPLTHPKPSSQGEGVTFSSWPVVLSGGVFVLFVVVCLFLV